MVNWPVSWPPEETNNVKQIGGPINPPFHFYYLLIFDLYLVSCYSTISLPCDQILDRVNKLNFI